MSVLCYQPVALVNVALRSFIFFGATTVKRQRQKSSNPLQWDFKIGQLKIIGFGWRKSEVIVSKG